MLGTVTGRVGSVVGNIAGKGAKMQATVVADAVHNLIDEINVAKAIARKEHAKFFYRPDATMTSEGFNLVVNGVRNKVYDFNSRYARFVGGLPVVYWKNVVKLVADFRYTAADAVSVSQIERWLTDIHNNIAAMVTDDGGPS